MAAAFPLNPHPNSTSNRHPLLETSRLSVTSKWQIQPISQSTIQELRQLKKQLQNIRAHHDKVQAEVVGKLRRGVPIQQGVLTARLVTRHCRYLSAKALCPLLGAAEVERLRDQVEPSVSHSVEISETD